MSEQATQTQTLDEKFINRLEKYVKDDDRAVLAHLRRGLGKEPATAMEMFPYVSRFTNNLYRKDENAFFSVASLIGLYPTMSWTSGGKGKDNLGKSLWTLEEKMREGKPRQPKDETKSSSVEKRFVALLNADEEDLPNHLRQIISLLKSNEMPVNWHELLRGIKQWNHPNRKIQREWAKEFWGNTNTEEEKGEQ
jgi:CRISPR system Cascade subunit CasB